MQIAELGFTRCDADVATSPQGNDTSEGVESRLEQILRVHRLSPPSAGRRERNFWRIVGGACEASDSGDPTVIAAANIALDLLSLELCDE